MKKVAAFCHFQKLVGALQGFGKGEYRSGIDHFVLFGLDDGHAAPLGQRLVRQPRHGGGDHEQSIQRTATRFDTTGQRRRDETAEGEPQQRQWQLRVLCLQPGQRRLGIIDLAEVHVVRARAAPYATVVETQGDISRITRRALQGGHHLVQHGPTLDRVGMADQRQPAGIGQIVVEAFQHTGGTFEGDGAFAFQQNELRDLG